MFEGVVIIADHGIDENGINDRETEDTAEEENDDKEESDKEGFGGWSITGDGIGNFEPSLNGKDFEHGVESLERVAEVFGGNFPEQEAGEHGKGKIEDKENEQEQNGGFGGSANTGEYVFNVRDKSNEADKLKGTHDPEDDEEIEFCYIGVADPEDEWGYGQGNEDGIEDIPGVVEESGSPEMFDFEENFQEEDNGKEVIGNFEDLLERVSGIKAQYEDNGGVQ